MTKPTNELLLELFSEEIPARMQARAAEDLKRLVVEGLKAQGLVTSAAHAFATPRRLALVVEGVPAQSPAISEERKGPRVGANEKAIEGFLKGAGLTSIDEAQIVKDEKKGDFYVARIDKPGRPARDLIEDVVPAVIASFPWPKSQRWGAGTLTWVRPLHSIVCLLDGKVIPVVAGDIVAGRHTQGHRFHGNAAFEVEGFEDYGRKLKMHKVLLPASERAQWIAEQARQLAKDAKLELVEDDGLMLEDAGLTEWPTVLMGTFDEAFLAVPAECLITSMKNHQKCFSLRNPKTGKLANRFLTVTNLIAKDGGAQIVAGNEKVIRARLSDAKFFWEQDLKRPLDEMAVQLRGITFHDKLGSQWDRVERVAELAFQIAGACDAVPEDARRAAQLCKADLVSGMTGEFPELQGLMGRYYAEAAGTKPEIARAIELHYKPKGPTDTVPREQDGDAVACAVALADKLDTLVGFWAIDEKPTGSGDPYQLRRAALGVIRIVLENDLRLPLRHAMEMALMGATRRTPREAFGEYSRMNRAVWLDEIEQALGSIKPVYGMAYFLRSDGNFYSYLNATKDPKSDVEQQVLEGRAEATKNRLDDLFVYTADYAEFLSGKRFNDSANTELIKLDERLRQEAQPLIDDLLSFFADRLKVHLREKGARPDLIDAVFSLGGQDDLALIVKRVEALSAFLNTDDGAIVLAGVKRAANILAIEEKKDKKSHAGAYDLKLLVDKEELALAAAIEAVKQDTVAAINVESFAGAMRALAELRAPVDAFFEKVTVNVDDPKIRENRLRMLSEIRAATLNVADFSKIAG